MAQRSGITAEQKRKHREQVEDAIKKHGWFVYSVAPREDSSDPEEWWGYTVGLQTTFGHPEICLFGQDAEGAIDLLNDMGALVKAGRCFEDGSSSAEIFKERLCKFRAVDPKKKGDYFVGADAIQPDGYSMLQAFWPDAKGKFPWERGCDKEVCDLQPLLF